MKLLLPFAVWILMVSIGMSLNVRELVANWRRLTLAHWAELLLATFILPPALILLLARILPLRPPELLGLFMVAVAPGAPLLTRAIAKKGFDMHLAASYQVWGAVLTPVMIPLIVFAAGKLYDRDIWIPPRLLLEQIATKQFVPLLVGLALTYFIPALSRRFQPGLIFLGNAILTIAMVALLVKMGPALRQMSPWVFVAAILLALGCMAAVILVRWHNRIGSFTLALSNTNRHVGLALLLSGEYLHNRKALPAVACYALAAPLLMAIAARFARNPNQAADALAPAA